MTEVVEADQGTAPVLQICDQVREQPDGEDDSEEEKNRSDDGLDPRVEGELENLNKSSNDINILEKELDEARAVFRQRLTDAARNLKTLAKTLGNSIDKARPYFEALSQSKKSQLECQNAAMTFERACEVHSNACDEISSAEEKLMHNPAMFDQAWQEMLNAANTKLMEAEKEKIKHENIHLEAALAYRELEEHATMLERKLRKSVNKARPYFEQRTIYLGCLEEQKERVQELEGAYMAAKAQYAQSLRNLELISEDIHKVRSSQNSSATSTPTPLRQECVGAEQEGASSASSEPPTNPDTATTSAGIPSPSQRKQKTGRYRSSLVLDLDLDIDLAENIDSLPKSLSPSVQSVDVACVAMKYYDDYQVLDIMPFFEKEKHQRTKNRLDEYSTSGKSNKTVHRTHSDHTTRCSQTEPSSTNSHVNRVIKKAPSSITSSVQSSESTDTSMSSTGLESDLSNMNIRGSKSTPF